MRARVAASSRSICLEAASPRSRSSSVSAVGARSAVGLEGGEPGRDLGPLAVDLLGQLLPGGPLLGLPRQPLLDALAGAGVLLGLAPGTGGGILALRHLALERSDLLPQGGRGIDRLRRRHERPGFEPRLLAVGAMEPDAELAGELQRGQRLRMGALDLVGRAVPRLAQRVEHVRDLLRDDPLVGEAPQRLLEGLALSLIGALAGRDLLGQQLRELAQLEDGRGRVVAEVTLRQRGKLDQLRVVNAQERKVGAGQHPPALP